MAKIQNPSECVAWSLGNLAEMQGKKIDREELDNFLRKELNIPEGKGINDARALRVLKKAGRIKDFRLLQFAELTKFNKYPVFGHRRVFKGVKFKKRNGSIVYDSSTATLTGTTHAIVVTKVDDKDIWCYDTGYANEKLQSYRVPRIDERKVFYRLYAVTF